MLLYLSGPMAGIPGKNKKAFETARHALRDYGYEVICPSELGQINNWTWEQYLRRDLAELVKCDAVALLPNWEKSKGANLEVYVAKALQMPTALVPDWIY